MLVGMKSIKNLDRDAWKLQLNAFMWRKVKTLKLKRKVFLMFYVMFYVFMLLFVFYIC